VTFVPIGLSLFQGLLQKESHKAMKLVESNIPNSLASMSKHGSKGQVFKNKTPHYGHARALFRCHDNFPIWDIPEMECQKQGLWANPN